MALQVKDKPKVEKATIYFEKFSQRQLQVLTWWMDDSPVKDSRAIICHGAIRSGKTLIMSMSYIMWAMANFNGMQFGIAGKTIASLKRNLVNTLIEVMRIRGYSVKERRVDNLLIIEYEGHKNYFYLFGGRDESSQDLVQGFTAAGFFFDEVTLMPQSFVNQCMARCSVTGNKKWFNCNPDSPFHWFKTEILDRSTELNYLVLHFQLYDNPSLAEEVIKDYELAYTGVFYDRYIKGLWAVGDGVIYDNFNYRTMVWEVNEYAGWEFGETYVSIDYGTSNPTTFKMWRKVAYAGNRGHRKEVPEWLCTNEYYHSGREGDAYINGTKFPQKGSMQKTDDEYIADLKKFCGEVCSIYDSQGNFVMYDWSRVVLIIDPSAASFRIAAKKAGFRTRRAKNDVLNGIRTQAALMNKNVVAWSENCDRTFKEFGSYVWDSKKKDGEDAPVKDHDHTLDADRYFCYTILKKKLGVSVWK